ncbi:hypothetical protein G7Z17_g7754 [Cylindrodendrum hubeiense]|uniref:Uncharacterized protein n=1 Tax=Cylindrodendrum hubeiense TaxID=595255 RepID=A0A9P5LF14_9HYPO|nr:hypothetical protein G7Z17_g7754 [Cylindrodendrum hubeiense]
MSAAKGNDGKNLADRVTPLSMPSGPSPTYALGRLLAEVNQPYHRPPPGFQPTMSVAGAVAVAEKRAQSLIAALERPLLQPAKTQA